MSLRDLKRIFLGAPLASTELVHQRLSKKVALAVFSSDALSSVAYATEEILLVLVLTGMAGVQLSLPIAMAIGILLVIVLISYSQTIHAYPSGGGAYIVAKENLGKVPGLIAASCLMIDYVLTVSVSIASGVAAITSAFPNLYPYKILLCLFFIFLITLANLRGVKESGVLFAIPTYLFIGIFTILIAVGFYKYFLGSRPEIPVLTDLQATQSLSFFLILRAFSSGCAALTGIEAISNGVQAFKPPEAKNARITLVVMGVILLSLFLGITELTRFYHIVPQGHETVVSQMTRQVFGSGFFYYVIQASTMLILILAANTGFADFPRLASLLARDSFMPRQMSSMGDRLAFSNGILLLGLCSGALVVLFQANTHHLIPLYAIGVFVSFTLSQAGMVQHWIKLKEKGWRRGILINGIGALATGIASIVISATKFMHGAWMVITFIPILALWFNSVRRHYDSIVEQLHPQLSDLLPPKTHRVLIPISTFHKGTAKAISYALSISEDVRGVYVGLDPERTVKMKEIWDAWCIDIPLIVLESPYRSILRPLTDYIEELKKEEKDQLITVVLPEFVPAKWWQQILHNKTALLIRSALMFQKNVVVTSARHFLAY